jgi:hypothetical protein
MAVEISGRVNSCNIAFTVIDLQKGEIKAQACDIACSRQLPHTHLGEESHVKN